MIFLPDCAAAFAAKAARRKRGNSFFIAKPSRRNSEVILP